MWNIVGTIKIYLIDPINFERHARKLRFISLTSVSADISSLGQTLRNFFFVKSRLVVQIHK